MPSLTSMWHAPIAALLVASLAGCGPALSEPADASAVPPAELASEAPVREGAEAPRPSAVDPDDPGVCTPPDGGRPWIETGRVVEDGYTYVFLEHADAGASADFDAAIAVLHEGTCESAVVTGPGELDTSTYRRIRNLDLWDSLVDQSFAWHVAQSGGVERFADVLREAYGPLIECAPRQDPDTCALPWLAERLRRAGVEVGVNP